MSVTNDAENVVASFRKIYGPAVRVVYRDTNMEWWEIIPVPGPLGVSIIDVSFKPWYGLEWDILSHKEK